MSNIIHNIRSLSELAGIVRLAEARNEQVVYLGDHSVRLVKRHAVENALNHATNQSGREAAALDRFATQLRERDNLAQGRPLLSREARLQALLGKTIDAAVATRFMAEARLTFDGTGRLLGGPPGGGELSELELTRLEGAVRSDLGRTNAQGERTAARTESECVLELLGALRQAAARGDPNAKHALETSENTLRDLWLSGQMTAATAQAALSQAAADLSSLAPPLADQARRLADEVGKDKHLTQRHDNTFGRMFESALGKALVDQPAPSMTAAASAVNRYLLQHVLTPQKHYDVDQNIDILAKALAKDPRPWHAEVPEIRAFLNKPDVQSLKGLLEPPVEDGFHMLMTYWVAAKVSSEVTGPWMSAANDNYNRTVKPNRSSQDTVTSTKGATHAAQAGLQALKTLDTLDRLLLKEIAHASNGSTEKAELRALRNDLTSLNTALSQAAGMQDRADGSRRTDRKELIQAITQVADRANDLKPEIANSLRELLSPLTTVPEGRTEDDIVLEVGTHGGVGTVPGWEAQAIKSAHYGTGLLHQPRPDVPSNWQAQVNVPARTGVDVTAPKTFERNALEHNQNTVNGVSGTTNMLAFLLNHMERDGALKTADGQALNQGDALAGNLAFLVMDGGHSIPEAMATAASIAADPREVPAQDFMHLPVDEIKAARQAVQEEVQANRQAVLDRHITSYADLGQALGGGNTGSRLADAVQAAFEVTRSQFDQIHAQR